jgi:succinoglycan biosynthesis protein ExoL
LKKIAYLVHDLSDSAIRRRVQMLLAGGAEVSLAGFRRAAFPVAEIEGIRPIDLGRTVDADLGQRVVHLARVLLNFRRYLPAFAGSDAFVARNLEMLLVAIRARALLKGRQPVTYECLDIHRQQISTRLPGRLIRQIESMMLDRSQLLMTSSPAFVTAYFSGLLRSAIRNEIVENKVLDLEGSNASGKGRGDRPGPPWVIGWFGQVRCRRSFEILRNISNRFAGDVRIVTAGRPAAAVFENFETLVSESPHFSFLGPYRNPEDLAVLYDRVHFSWTIDYFETGTNSRWLLPNRLYESGLYGAVPIALRDVETGHWLAQRKLGVLLSDPIEQSLFEFFQSLTAGTYIERAAAVAEAPRSTWAHDVTDCRRVVELITSSRSGDQ